MRRNLTHNASGYTDLTAFYAINNVERDRGRRERRTKKAKPPESRKQPASQSNNYPRVYV